ncbi:MAG: aminotransferase class V-fold PLP-dependent enzyme [Rhizobacter sp.]|nr:aminotransferase class V-fold PLP-dependent enzyme [Chlorobiales bacterium]
MYKSHYSRFLAADSERLHFAAHSHYYWPDVTREAALQCWDDAAHFADKKWTHIFETVLPEAQRHVANRLGLTHPEQIAFAPNTHEFVNRLLSCIDHAPVRVLTTDSEFHSFSRQLARLKEAGKVKVKEVPARPFETFEARFKQAASEETFDLMFFSHVFYNSSVIVRDLPAIVAAVASPETLVVIDGYHSFGAIPVSLAGIENRVFYMSGGYKYAQAGEGVCFLAVPKGCVLRPENTGWFATFGSLDAATSKGVDYSSDGFRFWGATFEPSGLYRLNAVMRWMQSQSLDAATIDKYVRGLQRQFLEILDELQLPHLNRHNLIAPFDPNRIAHFLTFKLPNAVTVAAALEQLNIYVDVRADRLRFGFGLYQDTSDIEKLSLRLKTLSPAPSIPVR